MCTYKLLRRFWFLKYRQLFKHFKPDELLSCSDSRSPFMKISNEQLIEKEADVLLEVELSNFSVQSDNSSVLSEPPSDSIHVSRAFSSSRFTQVFISFTVCLSRMCPSRDITDY